MDANASPVSAKVTRYYSFHGLSIAVSADDPNLLAVIHSRLRHFALTKAPAEASDIAFDFHSVPASEEHVVSEPVGPIRPVYESSLGQVTFCDVEDVLYIDAGQHCKAICNPRDGCVHISMVRTEPPELWLPSHPLVTLPLIEMLKRRGYYNIHAAGVCIEGQGILFPGNSGSGKSTLGLALLRGGCNFLGDDMQFLTADQAGWRALSFPDEIDITEQTITFFPELQHLLEQSQALDWPKRRVLAEELYQVNYIESCIPRFLVFPKIASTPTSVLKPMSTNEALLELIPNILLTEVSSSQAHLDALTGLATQCHCYRLETGQDFSNLPHLLKSLSTLS